MKKFITLVIIMTSLLTTSAYADEYYGHSDIYFPYEEINVGDVFWTDNCFIYYPRANGFSEGIECYDDQSVTVVSKADRYSDHPIYISGNGLEGWVGMDFFYCKKSESDRSIYGDYSVSYNDIAVGDHLILHSDKVYRYANGSADYVNIKEEGVYVEVVAKYYENSDHPIQVKSVDSEEYYGWVNIEDLYAYGGNC